MINWKPFSSAVQLHELISESVTNRVFIFKHSNRCSISGMAKMRLEDSWDPAFSEGSTVYLLDVVNHRALSQQVAQHFEVHHESPQILLIENGECTHDASHFDITAQEIREVI